MITSQELLNILNYDSSSGHFYHTSTGKMAGSLDRGKITVCINSKRYPAHNLVWFLETGKFPDTTLIHINNNKSDNRFGNLQQTIKKINNFKVDQKSLKELLCYNPLTGVFTWKSKVQNSPANIGDTAGYDVKGYTMMSIHDSRYYAHRLAWLWKHGEFPTFEIDHINHNRKDNRICNLREVKHIDNCRNCSMNSNNTSGATGVYFNKITKLWLANITVNKVRKYIGEYSNKADAIRARKSYEEYYGFHKNHGDLSR